MLKRKRNILKAFRLISKGDAVARAIPALIEGYKAAFDMALINRAGFDAKVDALLPDEIESPENIREFYVEYRARIQKAAIKLARGAVKEGHYSLPPTDEMSEHDLARLSVLMDTLDKLIEAEL